jgi:hypothetical protein
MSIFDLESYLDGSTVLSSIPKKKAPLQPAARAAISVRRMPATAPAPQAEAQSVDASTDEPPVADIEQELEADQGNDEGFASDEQDQAQAEAEMDAATAAMDEGGEDEGGGGASPAEEGGGDSGGGGGGGSAAPVSSDAAPLEDTTPVQTPGGVSNFQLWNATAYRGPVRPDSDLQNMPTETLDAGARMARTARTSMMSAPAMRTSTVARTATKAAPARTATVARTSAVAAPVARTATVARTSAVAAPVARTSTVARTAAPISRTAVAAPMRTAMRTAVRGDEPLPFVLPSVLPGVPDEAWTRFVIAVRNDTPVGAVSDSNELGAFSIKPKRLGDLGLIKNLQQTRTKQGRVVWTGDFAAPMTPKRFLSDPKAQYQAFAASMADYGRKLKSGEIKKPEGGVPEGTTLSGVLALLHRCGPSGLATLNDPEKLFPQTRSMYSRCNGIF